MHENIEKSSRHIVKCLKKSMTWGLCSSGRELPDFEVKSQYGQINVC
jgi:hypothetical protein